jgi:hypothetical protein
MQLNPVSGIAAFFGGESGAAVSNEESAEFSVPATPAEATPDPMLAVDEAIASLLAKIASPDNPPPNSQIQVGSEAEETQQTAELTVQDGDLPNPEPGKPVELGKTTPLWSKQFGYLTFMSRGSQPAPLQEILPKGEATELRDGPVFMWRSQTPTADVKPTTVTPPAQEQEPGKKGPVFMWAGQPGRGIVPPPVTTPPAPAQISAEPPRREGPVFMWTGGSAGAGLRAAAETAVAAGVPAQVVAQAIEASGDKPDVELLTAKLGELAAAHTSDAEAISPLPARHDFDEMLNERRTPPQAQQAAIAAVSSRVTAAQTDIGEVSLPDRLVQRVSAHIKELFDAKQPRTMTIRLDPPELGSIDLTVRTVGQRVETTILASNGEVKAILDGNRQQLIRALESQGLELGSMSVGQQASSRGQHSETTLQQPASWRPEPVSIGSTASAGGWQTTELDLMV